MKSPYYIVLTKTKEIDITKYINSLKHVDTIDENNITTLSMSGVPIPLLDEQYLGEGILLNIKYGYLGGAISRNKLCRITNIEYSYSSTVNITIQCTDKGFILKKGSKTKVWEDLSAIEIANEIAKKHGLETDIDSEINGDDKFKKKIDFLPQVNNNDYDTIKKALSISGTGDFIVYTRDDKLIIKRRGIKDKSSRKFTYQNGDGIFISFKPKAKDTDRSEFSANSIVSSINPEDNTLEEQSSDKSDNYTGDKKANYVVDGYEDYKEYTDGSSEPEPVEGKLIKPVDTPDEASIIAKKENNDKALNDITATLVVEGDPNLLSDTVITINGVAAKHNGNWYATKVVHSINSSGYKCTLELNKNGANRSQVSNATIQDNVNNTEGSEEGQNKHMVEYIKD